MRGTKQLIDDLRAEQTCLGPNREATGVGGPARWDRYERAIAFIAGRGSDALQTPQGWNSIPSLPPVEAMEWYGDQYSAPVLLRSGEGVLPVVARWNFIEDGWVNAQLTDGQSPADYEYLNKQLVEWRLLSDAASAAPAASPRADIDDALNKSRAESDMRAAFAKNMGQPWEAAVEAARHIWSLAWGASRYYARQAMQVDGIASELWKAADECGFDQFREHVHTALAVIVGAELGRNEDAPTNQRALAQSMIEVEALSFTEDRGITVGEAESMALVLGELRRLLGGGSPAPWTWLRRAINRIPTRDESHDGQNVSYVQLDAVLESVNEGERLGDALCTNAVVHPAVVGETGGVQAPVAYILSGPDGDGLVWAKDLHQARTDLVRTPLVVDPFALALPAELHPDTANLVRQFSQALGDKLLSAQRKYGYTNNWKRPDWADECRFEMMRHIEKGDPLDVGAYIVFLWYHKGSTAPCMAVKAHELAVTVSDLGMLVRQFIHAARNRVPAGCIADQAAAYLARKGMTGSTPRSTRADFAAPITVDLRARMEWADGILKQLPALDLTIAVEKIISLYEDEDDRGIALYAIRALADMRAREALFLFTDARVAHAAANAPVIELPPRVIDKLFQAADVSTYHPDGDQLEKLHAFARNVVAETLARLPTPRTYASLLAEDAALTAELHVLSANEEAMEEAIETFAGSSTGEALKCVFRSQKQLRHIIVEANKSDAGEVVRPGQIGSGRAHSASVYDTNPFDRAFAKLPEYWKVEVNLELGAGGVALISPTGERFDMSPDVERFEDQIHDAIDAALAPEEAPVQGANARNADAVAVEHAR